MEAIAMDLPDGKWQEWAAGVDEKVSGVKRSLKWLVQWLLQALVQVAVQMAAQVRVQMAVGWLFKRSNGSVQMAVEWLSACSNGYSMALRDPSFTQPPWQPTQVFGSGPA
eukprot:364186-Chlamydomonas_euryale.AAC.3